MITGRENIIGRLLFLSHWRPKRTLIKNDNAVYMVNQQRYSSLLILKKRENKLQVFCKCNKRPACCTCKRFELMCSKSSQRWSPVLFLHDNVKLHMADTTKHATKILDWEIFPHPLYSTDVVPLDYYLCPWTCGNINSEAEMMSQRILYNFGILKKMYFFKKGIYELVSRCENVTEANGTYCKE